MSNLNNSNPENEITLYKNLQKRELTFKFVVIGDFGVGKTSIIGRYTDGEFSTTYKVTLGTDFAQKTIEWDEDTRINLNIWDIAGYQRFGALTGVFYRYAVVAIIVYDLTRPSTFESVNKWLTDLRRKTHLPGGQPVPVIILANKGDVALDAVADEDVMNEYCSTNNILEWFITSAKDNINIDQAMMRAINVALEYQQNIPFPPLDNDVINLNSTQKKNPRKCCYS